MWAMVPLMRQATGLSAFVTCELLNACLMSPALAISLRMAGMALAIFAASCRPEASTHLPAEAFKDVAYPDDGWALTA